MAKTTLATEMLWRSLREQRLVLPTDFWSLLNKCFLSVLSDIQQTVESCPDTVPAPVSGRIVIQIEKMIVLFRQMKTSLNPAGSSSSDIVIPSDVRSLMAHYLGNDLQRMLWVADEGGSDSRAIILECAGDIKAFFIRLRAETGEPAS
jgi:hypothetical protein